jgi:hypothetical protein
MVKKIVLHKMDLIYGKEYGVTRAEAKKAYIKGFKQSMKKHEGAWKDKKVRFIK